MKQLTVILALSIFTIHAQAQTLKGLINKTTKKDSATGKSMLDEIVSTGSTSPLTNTDVINGLKEALTKGANLTSNKLSVANGFFGDAALKILMPDEAKQVEQTLRGMGLGKQVDDAILAMNRAAEDASKSAAPIFVDAIKNITITDGMNILKGSDTAATAYLHSKTVSPLTEAFRPVIETSLQKVNATKYWKSVFSTYNMVAAKKINPDLTAYVTERAMSGLFLQLGKEETEIRKNPAARTTELLKKVFSN
jgi:hypothetical protein